MRRLFVGIVGFAALLIFSAGCVNVTQGMTVKSDGSVDLMSKVLVQNSVLTMGGLSLDEALASWKSHMQVPAKVVKGIDASGVESTTHFDNLNAALSALTKPDIGGGATMFSKATVKDSGGFFNSSRHFEFQTDVGEIQAEVASSDPGYQPGQEIASSMLTLHFSLTLPEQVSDATAGGVISSDKHTVTWAIPLDRSVALQVNGVSGPPIWLFVGGGAAAVILAAGGVWFLRRRTVQPPVAVPARRPALG